MKGHRDIEQVVPVIAIVGACLPAAPQRGHRKEGEGPSARPGVPLAHVLEVFMTTYLRVTSAIITVLILAACAATPTSVKPKAEASGAVVQNSACLSQTGTRIAGDNTHCSAIGRSYSSDDINRTGSTTAGEALRLLDPSITVHQ